MPKKRKPGRPPGTKARKKKPRTPGFLARCWRRGLIIFGIVLFFGAFISAPMPHDVWHGVWWALGAATWIAPFALIYLGSLKFINEDQRIPLPNMIGTIGLLVFLASWLHHLSCTDAAGTLVGGHGGHVGKASATYWLNALGKFLASLVFFLLAVFSFMFTFAIEPRSLLKLLTIFRREPKEPKAKSEEDLGVTEAQNVARFPAARRRAGGTPQRAGPDGRYAGQRRKGGAGAAEHAALTTAKDPDWQFPSLELLSAKQDKADAGDVKGNAQIIKDTFANFGIHVEVEGANVGPRVTQYTLKPPTGVKLTKLTALENNLALDLAATSIRMEAPIPGKRAVGIEVPNVRPATVTLRGLFTGPEWSESKGSLEFRGRQGYRRQADCRRPGRDAAPADCRPDQIR